MGTLSSSFPLILRRLLRPPPPTHPSSLLPPFIFKHPLSISLQTTSLCISHFLTSSNSLSLSSSNRHSLSILNSETQTPFVLEEEIENVVEEDSGSNEDFEPEKDGRSENALDSKISITHKELLSKLESMSVKEKKELVSFAHSLGKKLKSQQVGKSGVTDSVATALVETLEANELLKLKIHNNCPGELDEVVEQLEGATGSVVVGRIGRTVIIYRPSLTKLKAEEKKKLAQKIFLKRRAAFKSSFQNRGQSTLLTGRGRRGSRRS